MTVLQKKTDNPIAHLTPEDIEQHRRRARRDPRSTSSTRRGADDAAYIRKVIDAQRKLELGSRAVLLVSLFPPAWVRRHRRPLGRQDHREHGDRPQRHARPVGLDARPEDPLDHLGVGQRLARRSSGSTRTTSCTTPTRTSSARTTTSATASCASTRTSAGCPLYLAQPLWNFINACFFEYGIAAYDLELGKNLATKKRRPDPEFKAARQGRR